MGNQNWNGFRQPKTRNRLWFVRSLKYTSEGRFVVLIRVLWIWLLFWFQNRCLKLRVIDLIFFFFALCVSDLLDLFLFFDHFSSCLNLWILFIYLLLVSSFILIVHVTFLPFWLYVRSVAIASFIFWKENI